MVKFSTVFSLMPSLEIQIIFLNIKYILKEWRVYCDDL